MKNFSTDKTKIPQGNFLLRAKSFVDNTNIIILIAVPIFLGLIIFYLVLILGFQLFVEADNARSDIVLATATISSCTIISMAGVVQIYRKETFGFRLMQPIRGIWAAISGWLLLGMCGSAILATIMALLSKY